MEELLGQIAAAMDAGLYYVALIGALAIPDMCAGLQAPNGRTNEARYSRWFDDNVGDRYIAIEPPYLRGIDVYKWRCSLLHQGSSITHAGSHFDRIFVVEPNPRIVGALTVISDHEGETIIALDQRSFVADVVDSATAWWAASKDDPLVAANYGKFIRRHPEGFSPLIVGLPLYG